MIPPNSAFPWFFFWKIARLQTLVLIALWLVVVAWDRNIAISLLPFFLLTLGIFLAIFAYITRPLRAVLKRVGAIVQFQLPHERQLDLYYQKDEWAKIAAALEDADQRQRSQLKTIKEENRKFTTLLASISNEILAVDPQANVLFHNPRFLRTFIGNREKLQDGGKLWSVLEYADARGVFEQVLQDPQTRKLKGFPVQIGKDTRYYNLTVSPLPDDTGVSHGAVGVFTDVTEAKLTEQMRVDFVANVSHEIRTPLTSIKGFTQVLKANQARIPEELHDFLGKILHNTERMIALFTDLLSLSVIESRDRMQIEKTSLGEILDHVEAGVKALHREKSFVLERDIEVDEIDADAKLFEQVLTNLIENACKYAGSTPVVRVSARYEENNLIIKVADNGPGIAKEHLGRIFERFYRIDSSRERATGGTGLGLAIAKHIVVKHKGAIRAESDGANGTTFILEFPR